ncbi:MAG: DUF456 domain-containing protein [Anaerolineaceae bacterium]|nr:DUF456 domain-containing protein [Anaerolineaceae bacterium]
MNPILEGSLDTIVVIGILIGILGNFIPFFPAVTITWLAILGYGLIHGFNWGSGVIFTVITILLIAGNLIDNLMMGAGARQKGTSWIAIAVSFLTMVVVSFIASPLVGLLASLLALFIVEAIRIRDLKKAFNSMGGMSVGCMTAMVVRFFICLVMAWLWLIWALFAVD